MFLQLLETLSCTIEKFEPVHIILCRWSFHQLFFIIACGWFFVYKRLIEVILMKFGLDSKRILQISMIDELGFVALIVVDGSKYNHSVTESLFQFTWFISLQASLAAVQKEAPMRVSREELEWQSLATNQSDSRPEHSLEWYQTQWFK